MLVLFCEKGATRMSVVRPFRSTSSEGSDLHATLIVDGAAFTLRGKSEFDHNHDAFVMVGAPMSDEAVEALASGNAAAVIVPGSAYPIHLSGSRVALNMLIRGC